jgi:RNA polymerase sigma-70 factor (ECF subfamily)
LREKFRAPILGTMERKDARPNGVTAAQMARDMELVSAAAAGDERALRALLGRVAPRLRNVAWHLCHHHHDAQDLCQEALAKLTTPSVLGAFRGDGPLDVYLMNVGVRAMISVRRMQRERAWQQVERLDSLERLSNARAAEQREFEGFDSRLRDALHALPERAQLVVLLIAVAEYSYQDVAEMTALPLGTVKSVYYRARRALRHGWPATR